MQLSKDDPGDVRVPLHVLLWRALGVVEHEACIPQDERLGLPDTSAWQTLSHLSEAPDALQLLFIAMTVLGEPLGEYVIFTDGQDLLVDDTQRRLFLAHQLVISKLRGGAIRAFGRMMTVNDDLRLQRDAVPRAIPRSDWQARAIPDYQNEMLDVRDWTGPYGRWVPNHGATWHHVEVVLTDINKAFPPIPLITTTATPPSCATEISQGCCQPAFLFSEDNGRSWVLNLDNEKHTLSGLGEHDELVRGFLVLSQLIASPMRTLYTPLLDALEVRFVTSLNPRYTSRLRDLQKLFDGCNPFDLGSTTDVQSLPPVDWNSIELGFVGPSAAKTVRGVSMLSLLAWFPSEEETQEIVNLATSASVREKALALKRIDALKFFADRIGVLRTFEDHMTSIRRRLGRCEEVMQRAGLSTDDKKLQKTANDNVINAINRCLESKLIGNQVQEPLREQAKQHFGPSGLTGSSRALLHTGSYIAYVPELAR